MVCVSWDIGRARMVSEFDSRSTVMLDNLSDKGERRSKNGGRVGMGECNVTFDFIFSKNSGRM
jgi:hypothetical protein